jgi:hypothetical protein
MSAAGDRVGVMVLRTWNEPSTGSLRVRVTQTYDINARDERSDVVATFAEVLILVREWLETFEAISDTREWDTR